MHKIKVLIVTVTVLAMFVLGYSNIAYASHKVLVNHMDETRTTKVLCISAFSLKAHLGHGDTIVDADGDTWADSCSP